MKSTNTDSSSQTLPVYETFYAFQGEGTFIGCAAYFVRTYGCPVQCEWCDSANTWKSQIDSADFQRVEVSRLADKAAESGTKIVVITGGEPTIHNLLPLTQELHKRGLRVHLETCGAYPIRGDFDWITVSPKWNAMPLSENIRRANEIKVIVENEDSIERWWAVIEENYSSRTDLFSEANIWLQPESQTLFDNPELLNTITNAVKAFPTRYRAGVQLHKLYHCDDLDPESRK